VFLLLLVLLLLPVFLLLLLGLRAIGTAPSAGPAPATVPAPAARARRTGCGMRHRTAGTAESRRFLPLPRRTTRRLLTCISAGYRVYYRPKFAAGALRLIAVQPVSPLEVYFPALSDRGNVAQAPAGVARVAASAPGCLGAWVPPPLGRRLGAASSQCQ
jgi:hypothetical protein